MLNTQNGAIFLLWARNGLVFRVMERDSLVVSAANSNDAKA